MKDFLEENYNNYLWSFVNQTEKKYFGHLK
jgi:hypothetical protein